MKKAFRAFCRTLLIRLQIIPVPDLLVRIVADHPSPSNLEVGLIYVVESSGFPKWAYFRCPADSNEVIQLSLMPNHRPRWNVLIDFLQRPTITPSVRQLDGSYAHFWIKKGRINWCEDTGMKPLPNIKFQI
ncbi:MAG: DUF6527 family protein [Gammaproteobacteria bacterium]|nr:DUF6527 family protein [Gammaproteobacteria bacterium]